MINKKILSVVVVVLGSIAIWIFSSDMFPKLEPLSTPTPDSSGGVDLSNMIVVDQPSSDQLIKSPVLVSGKARGNWFFEASFPVKILDDNGKELLAVPVQAGSDWMTEDFVPFSASLEFKKPETPRGVIVFKKDNPSGLPEHDAELRVPVIFDLNNWPSATEGPDISKACRVTGCSGQICSDEDVVTTCEFKPEYTCFKTAKCERQEDGKCGWTPTEELLICLQSALQ